MSELTAFSAAIGSGGVTCEGCIDLAPRASWGCVCCPSEVAAVALPAGQHWMCLCLRCFRTLRAVRAEATPRKKLRGVVLIEGVA